MAQNQVLRVAALAFVEITEPFELIRFPEGQVIPARYLESLLKGRRVDYRALPGELCTLYDYRHRSSIEIFSRIFRLRYDKSGIIITIERGL